jgi:hypothetical protein
MTFAPVVFWQAQPRRVCFQTADLLAAMQSDWPQAERAELLALFGVPRAILPTALAMPMAAMSAARAPASRRALRQVSTVVAHKSSGSCTTSPPAGKCCGNSRWARRRPRVGPKQDGPRRRRALVDG